MNLLSMVVPLLAAVVSYDKAPVLEFPAVKGSRSYQTEIIDAKGVSYPLIGSVEPKVSLAALWPRLPQGELTVICRRSLWTYTFDTDTEAGRVRIRKTTPPTETPRTLDRRLEPWMIQAHRGACDEAPENTLLAYKEALKRGFSLELDLYLTLDDVIYASHDYDLTQRQSGVNKLATNVYWKGELEFADPGRYRGEKWSGMKYPRWEEICALVDRELQPKATVSVEVKDPRKELITPKIAAVMAKYPGLTPERVQFNNNMPMTKRCFPGYTDTGCMLVREGWKPGDKPLDVKAKIDALAKEDFKIWAPRWDFELVTAEMIAYAHSKGMKVVVWTVNHPADALEAFRRGADFVNTDRPIKLYEELGKIWSRGWGQAPDGTFWNNHSLRDDRAR